MVNRIPSGNAVYFSCQFTEDRHIINVKVLHTSGFPNFDSAVQDVITRLDGNSILAFPARSKRHVMPQIFGIRTADHPAPISTP